MEKGMESPIAIDTLQQSLFEMKSCLLRQSQLKRLPNPETTTEYKTRMEKLEQVQASLASEEREQMVKQTTPSQLFSHLFALLRETPTVPPLSSAMD